MSVWDNASASKSAIGLLQRDVATDRVAHAYLFAGAAGRLPLEAALAFGAALVCETGGCGSCEACVRVSKHAHPDVEVIEPAGTQLLVDQVREVVRDASRRPVAGGRRVIVVDGADRMNPTAQNSFLKALEEPPASTTIVLLAPSPDALLETVRSRCREVAFRSPTTSEVAELLERTGTDAPSALTYARAGGSLERATLLARSPEVRALRDELVRRVIDPPADPGEALEAAEWLAAQTKLLRDRVAADHEEHQAAYQDWIQETKRVSEDRLRREQRRAEQDALDAAIDDIASVLRDLLVAIHSSDQDLINEDVRAPLLQRASELGSGAQASIVSCLADVERCRRRLRANANVLLALEGVFLALHKHLRADQLV